LRRQDDPCIAILPRIPFGTGFGVARFGLRARGPKHHQRRAYLGIDASFTQQDAQTRCADQMRYHQDASRLDIAILEGRFGFR
jgi:hypothetical protein